MLEQKSPFSAKVYVCLQWGRPRGKHHFSLGDHFFYAFGSDMNNSPMLLATHIPMRDMIQYLGSAKKRRKILLYYLCFFFKLGWTYVRLKSGRIIWTKGNPVYDYIYRQTQPLKSRKNWRTKIMENIESRNVLCFGLHGSCNSWKSVWKLCILNRGERKSYIHVWDFSIFREAEKIHFS